MSLHYRDSSRRERGESFEVPYQSGGGRSATAASWEEALFLCEQSRKYRAELEAFLEREITRLSTVVESVATQDYNAELIYIENAKSIFHLTEIFLIDPHSNVTTQMIDWLQRHIAEEPENMNCWDDACKLLVHGKFRETELLIDRLMASYSHEDAAIVSDIVLLLRTFPLLPGIDGGAKQQDRFLQTYHQWKAQAEGLEKRTDDVEMKKILRILIGDEETLGAYTEFWEELLVAKLMFVSPLATKADVEKIARSCYAIKDKRGYGSQGSNSNLSDLYMSIISREMDELIHYFEDYSRPWFLLHLYDILFRVHGSGRHEKVRDQLILEFVEPLLDHPLLWQLACEYLSCSPRQTHREYIRTCLELRPIDSEWQARKVLSLCKRYGLADTHQAICQQLGVNALRTQKEEEKGSIRNLGRAAYWFHRAGDPSRVANVCSLLIDRCCEIAYSSSVPSLMKILPTLKTVVAYCTEAKGIESLDIIHVHGRMEYATDVLPEIEFLNKFGQYCECRQKLSVLETGNLTGMVSGDEDDGMHRDDNPNIDNEQTTTKRQVSLREALRSISELLGSKLPLAPQRLWTYFLEECNTLLTEGLQTSEPMLEAERIYVLMACLEQQCDLQRQRQGKGGHREHNLADDTISSLRYNLQQAIMQDFLRF